MKISSDAWCKYPCIPFMTTFAYNIHQFEVIRTLLEKHLWTLPNSTSLRIFLSPYHNINMSTLFLQPLSPHFSHFLSTISLLEPPLKHQIFFSQLYLAPFSNFPSHTSSQGLPSKIRLILQSFLAWEVDLPLEFGTLALLYQAFFE